MTTIRTGRLASRHISSLRWQLMGALAVGWALGACGGEAATEDEAQSLPGPGAPEPEPEPTPELVPEPEPGPEPEPISCGAGYASEKCYSVEVLDAFARDSTYSMPSYTAEGCVDSTTATFAVAFGCVPYPAGPGVRRGDECCYQHCLSSPGCGRPFVVGGAARVAEPRPSLAWTRSSDAPPSQPGAPRGAEIGQEWLRDALAEHASVAAFSAFNLSLLALGAPARLVRASAAATLDEVFHATACFELARHYAGCSLGPGPLEITDLQLSTDLATVAERAFVDGCIGETAAALVARASLDACDSPRVAAVLERIAEDETKHAELAWQFVAWALQRGGEAVGRVLQRALERSATVPEGKACAASEAAPPEWHRAGRLSEAERAHILQQTLRDVVRPTLAVLLARQKPTRGARTNASPAV